MAHARVAQQFYDDNECSLTTTDEGFRFTAPAGVLEASPSESHHNFDLGSVQASTSTGPGGPLESRGLARVEVDALAPALPLCSTIDELKGTWNDRKAYVHAEAQYGARFPNLGAGSRPRTNKRRSWRRAAPLKSGP